MDSLQRLEDSDIEIAAVVTNPDKPAGRGMKMTPSPVKRAATETGLEVIQVARARDPELLDRLERIAPDIAIVVAYGSILPKHLLDVPAKGFVNLHFSLLPLYRGAAPVQRSIMNGDDVSGASVMVLTEGMDEGPVLARRELPIAFDDTTETYGGRLAALGADLLAETVFAYLDGTITPEPQDDSLATYAPKLTTEDALIDWNASARQIHDLVRALDPEPGAWTTLAGARLKIFKAPPADRVDLAPGELSIAGGSIVIGTGEGAVTLEEVQPATKRRMSGSDFARGLRLTGAERMGE